MRLSQHVFVYIFFAVSSTFSSQLPFNAMILDLHTYLLETITDKNLWDLLVCVYEAI